MTRLSLKKKIKKALYLLIGSLWWLFGLRFILGRISRKARILVYHKVSDTYPNHLVVSVSLFKKQIEYLRRRYRVISVEALVEHIHQKKDFPPNSVAVTFDDGYKDNYTHAYPILKEFTIPALIFLTSGYIDSDRILEHDRLFDPRFNPLLGTSEIVEMGRDVVTFGAHTVNHVDLKKTDLKGATREIVRSKGEIERILGKEVYYFSYPFGTRAEYGDEHKKIARDCGFKAAFTGITGTIGIDTDPFEIPRCPVEPDSFFLFKRLLDGSLDPIKIKDLFIFPTIKKGINRALGLPY